MRDRDRMRKEEEKRRGWGTDIYRERNKLAGRERESLSMAEDPNMNCFSLSM